MIDKTPVISPEGIVICEYTEQGQIIYSTNREKFIRPIDAEGKYTRELYVFDAAGKEWVVKKFDPGSSVTGTAVTTDEKGQKHISYFEFDKAHQTERGYYDPEKTRLKWEAKTDGDNATIEQNEYNTQNCKNSIVS